MHFVESGKKYSKIQKRAKIWIISMKAKNFFQITPMIMEDVLLASGS